MKKRVIVAAASVVLAALILLLLPLGHGGPGVSTDPGDLPNFTKPTGATGSTGNSAGGTVRLYSCDASAQTGLAELAAEYTALTGIAVQVLSAEADGCQATLEQLMESEAPPTMLCIHSQSQLEVWQETLLDLSGTALADALCSESLGLWVNDRLLGIPASLEGYGLLMNAQLLGTNALSRSDIYDLSSLATAAQILKSNSVTAFAVAQPTLQDAWSLLMSGDLQAVRSFLDLYLASGSNAGNALALFQAGKAAFFLGGSWEYAALEAADGALRVRNLDILPTFAAEGLQYLCSSAWCINAAAEQADVNATLDFLLWMVTAGETSPAPIDRLQRLTPFRDAAWYGNQLEKKLLGYMQSETVVAQWKEVGVTANQMLLALLAYTEDSSDENWNAICLAVESFKTRNG